MKIEIESTGRIEKFQGIDCRIWRGHTAKGIAVELMIPCVRALRSDDNSELESELREIKAERQLVSFDTRML